MLFLKLFVLAYLIAALLAAVMVFSAIKDKTWRLIFMLAGLALPGVFLYALVSSLISQKPVPCFHGEVAKVEDEIETERLRVFGGERTAPSFSHRWQFMYEAYVERMAVKAVHASEKIVAFTGALRPTV